MNFVREKFPKIFDPHNADHCICVVNPSGASAKTPRISSGRARASVNISRSVNSRGFSPSIGKSGGRKVIRTRVRLGNLMMKVGYTYKNLQSTNTGFVKH